MYAFVILMCQYGGFAVGNTCTVQYTIGTFETLKECRDVQSITPLSAGDKYNVYVTACIVKPRVEEHTRAK